MSHDWDLSATERYERARREADDSDPWKSARPLMRTAAGHLVQGPAPAQTAPQKISDEEYARLTYPEKVRYANNFAQR
jgi:hypothetical protein